MQVAVGQGQRLLYALKGLILFLFSSCERLERRIDAYLSNILFIRTHINVRTN